MPRANGPIGVFDSGVGGLTVVKELRRQMPQEDILYLGDTARMPYGCKTIPEIIEFMHEILTFMQKRGVKIAVFACNTMTAHGYHLAVGKYPFPLVGMDKGIAEALSRSTAKKVGVMATRATIASGSHEAALKALSCEAEIYPTPCPRFVPLIEDGHIDDELVEEAVREVALPMQEAGVDALVLGCTHYPYIAGAIRRVLGDKVALVDPAEATAREAKRVLAEHGLLKQEGVGKAELCFTANLDKSEELAHLIIEGENVIFKKVQLPSREESMTEK
ncbi:MAG: glutamate racemase [Selenomonadales bacterium]|nr:glutamate racemase [Selenomonadales bacterium]